MSFRTVLIVCGPLAAIGLAAAVSGTIRVSRAQRELAALAETSAIEGRAFAETLQGRHAEAQLDALDRRRRLARELATARRNRLLGGILVAGSAVLGLGLRALARMASEIEEDRRQAGAGPPGKVDWKGL